MKCYACDTEMIASKQDRFCEECGLDNVFLKNAEVHTCPSCGEEYVGFFRLPDLLAKIG